jgi:hypothetical protein
MDFMEGKGDQREGNLANGSTEEEGGIVLHWKEVGQIVRLYPGIREGWKLFRRYNTWWVRGRCQ